MGHTKQTKKQLGDVISDIPPPVPSIRSARCRTPDEFLAHRASFGDTTYAVMIFDESGGDDETWYFSNDLQEAVAIGLRWHERNCALEQYPLEQDGEIVYGYRVRGCDSREIEDTLYGDLFWGAVGANVNEVATPEIMTRVRVELFKFFAENFPDFQLLDFSQPDGKSGYLQDWANELECMPGSPGKPEMPSDNQIDLEVALRKIHELAMADGDLGYAYWYEVGRLLQRAAGMQAEIDMLRKELERCRARLAKTD